MYSYWTGKLAATVLSFTFSSKRR